MCLTVFFRCFGVRLFLEVRGQQGESSMHTKTIVYQTLVLFDEFHSVHCQLIGGPDEMPGQRSMSLNWTASCVYKMNQNA